MDGTISGNNIDSQRVETARLTANSQQMRNTARSQANNLPVSPCMFVGMVQVMVAQCGNPYPYTVHTPPMLLPTENVSIGLLDANLLNIPTGVVRHADELDRLKSYPVLNMRTWVHNNADGSIIFTKEC